MTNNHWLVSTRYELPHIDQYMDSAKLRAEIINELERHLKNSIRRFAQGKDDTDLYIIGGLGVLGIRQNGAFELRGFFAEETGSDKFKLALGYVFKRLPKEIGEELASNLVVVETGLELKLES